MNPHHNLPNYYFGDPNPVFDCIWNWKWIHYYIFVLYIFIKPTFWGVSYNRNKYNPMILLHIRTNYYFCSRYWYRRRLLARIYRIILSRRVALLYFCVVYYQETRLFRHFIEQKHVWYYDVSTHQYQITNTVYGSYKWNKKNAIINVNSIYSIYNSYCIMIH